MSANNKQVSGSHYKDKAVQPWDFIVQNGIGYLDGCAIKYLSRWRDKGGVDDLRKAVHFIEKLIETETAVEQDRLAEGFAAAVKENMEMSDYSPVETNPWREWKGGEHPPCADDKLVQVKLRNYPEDAPKRVAVTFRWTNEGWGSDIVAWRFA